MVLEEGESAEEDASAACVTAAGLALASAGVPMLDIVIGAAEKVPV